MPDKLFILLTVSLSLFAADCSSKGKVKQQDTSKMKEQFDQTKMDTAVLGGGCFWCLDAVYRRMKGVKTVESGYANGTLKNPTYREVCTGNTGHAEVVKIIFDSSQCSYAEILEVFWRIHNPTTLNRQGNDVGTQYRSGIYYLNDTQKETALKSRDAAVEAKLWDGTFVTEIVPLSCYYVAEAYHQDYFTNNPDQPYCIYVVGEKVDKFKKLFRDKMK